MTQSVAGAFARTGGDGTDRDDLEEVSAGAERQLRDVAVVRRGNAGPLFRTVDGGLSSAASTVVGRTLGFNDIALSD